MAFSNNLEANLAKGTAMGPKVDFVVVGAQKSGTTALRHFLRQHPQIGVPENEVHYFDERCDPGRDLSFSSYHDCFSDDELQRTTGDVTPSYLYISDCLPLIRTYNPDIKVIVLLRDPVARAFSQWIMQYDTGHESRSFWAAIVHEQYYKLRYGQHRVYSYIGRGFYSAQIQRLYGLFPENQCLVLRHSELSSDHANCLRRIFKFLEVSEDVEIHQERVHAREYLPVGGLIKYLLRLTFWLDSRYLLKLLNWDRY